MAAPNVGQLVAAAWQDYVSQDPVDNIFPRHWLLENLREGKSFRKGAGTPIVGNIEYATNTTVKAMGELDTVDVTRVDVFDRWEAVYRFVGGDIVMSEFEKAVTAGAAGIFDLMAGKIENVKSTCNNQMNSDLFGDGTGSGGLAATGLQALVSSTPTTGTVETINRATFSFWRNQQSSGAKTTTAYDNLKGSMRTVYNSCSNGPGQQNPEFCVTTQTIFEAYEGLSVSLERYNRDSDSNKLVSGFKGTQIAFKDTMLAYDAACPAGVLYELNKRNLFIRYMMWMKAFPPAQPVNQFADVVKVLTMYNLCTDNPRRLGVVTAIT